ncbi:uncharacterized protein LOC129938815 isoform X1 [Eupeodes corollae]|uniref:uncharacterized protein LOC129938815 isoform X1 n=1 Tax=Eupeodes corollae TaxID=290404 RepID=UPI00248FCF9A|nr:uncharacterized protein LOC129938815 isoform X1 [Eupeodes corollae]
MRKVCHIFFTTIILLEILLKSATGNENDGNGAMIDANFVESDGADDLEGEEEEQPIIKKERSKGVKNFVGTNLFGDTSGSPKNCFTSEDVALLAARRDFELLIPKTIPSCLLDDDLVRILMQYFYEANQVVDKMTIGHSNTIARKAFFDAMGGYLQFYMVPISMFSFYAGLIKLRTVENILELLDQSKSFLNTNGNGWRHPMTDFSNINIQIEPLQIVIDQMEQDTPCIELEVQDYRDVEKSDMIIDLPRLDIEENGHLGNIWLPFKRKNTFNLKTSQSAFVLLKYFDLTTRCYNFKDICQATFNGHFKKWIIENLEVHLKDEVLYPGLGAILRILETLRTNSNNKNFVIIKKREKTQNYKALESRAKQLEIHSKDWFRDIIGKSNTSNVDKKPLEKESNAAAADDNRRKMYIYATIIVVIFLLVFLISLAYIVKWSNTPPRSSSTDPDVEKCQKKGKRVRISEELQTQRRSSKDDEEILLGPESSSIISSSDMTRSSKPLEDTSVKNVKSPSSSSTCFPFCTRKNSPTELERDKPISSMDSDSANEELSEDPSTSKWSNVIHDRKYVRIKKKKTDEELIPPKSLE